jgi:hypothetical protein
MKISFREDADELAAASTGRPLIPFLISSAVSVMDASATLD